MGKRLAVATEKQASKMNLTMPIQRFIVDQFLKRFEKGALRAATRLRTIEQHKRTDHWNEKIKYWKNVVSGIKWLKSMNRQRSD